MTDPNLYDQIEDLRRQLNEVVARQKTGAESQAAVGDPAPLGGASDTSQAAPSPEWVHHLPTQLGEMLHGLQRELNEIPTATALAIFALGFLVGRLTSR